VARRRDAGAFRARLRGTPLASRLPRQAPMVEIVRSADVDKGWDRFVEHHPEATVAHLAGWGRAFARAYGHEPIYLSAMEAGERVGVLPLVLIQSRLFGRRLVSMPFLDYGGVLAEPGRGVEAALVDAALALARERRAASLGLRQFTPAPLPWPVADDRATMLLALTTEEAVWKALPSERRNRVRKGEKQGLTARWCGAEALDAFYRVYAANMRDLGSPPHGRAFFAQVLAELPGTARVLLVDDRDGRTVGAAVCLVFRDTVMVPWVSSLREAFALCPNFVLYWEVIRFGCRQGYGSLDLGRSYRHAGTFEFKRQWGARPHALPWIFLDAMDGAAPPVDRDASRFGPLVQAWKRLPLPVANAVGPWVRKQVPN
jgi:FemAB-related protein (PEP-CTERM system-associated)